MSVLYRSVIFVTVLCHFLSFFFQHQNFIEKLKILKFSGINIILQLILHKISPLARPRVYFQATIRIFIWNVTVNYFDFKRILRFLVLIFAILCRFTWKLTCICIFCCGIIITIDFIKYFKKSCFFSILD